MNERIEDQNMPVAILLGISDTGYETAKSLTLCGIPIIAFEKDPTRPETKTKLCREIHFYDNEAQLLEQLLKALDRLSQPPVLFLSGDALVNFFNEHRNILVGRVRVAFPETECVSTLLEKTRFDAFAIKHNFRVPKTVVVTNREALKQIVETLSFPCVIKPTWRSSAWKKAKFPKVFVFERPKDLKNKFGRIYDVEQDLLAQEWIPGGDADIYFCLTYFDHGGKCLADFTGRKLRQWPVGTGSTACAEPVFEANVQAETMRLFETSNFRGFGSVEFKRHANTGEFFIMEPTVGRCNHQSYVATANGVNFPCIAYQSLTGIDLGLPERSSCPVVWIDDQFDALSIIVSTFTGRLNLTNLFRSYLGKKSFRFCNRRDLGPLFHVLLQAPRKLSKFVLKRLVRVT